ncbi:MAG: OmpA family protein [Pseudomonadota bacterium]|nr:OmpA family protein [Pseudomonadota bacterium]
MRTGKLLAAMASLALLGGCAALQGESALEALNRAKPSGSGFTQALTEEYKALANFEWKDMYDYTDGMRYAMKGLAAAKGEVVMPDDLSKRQLEPQHRAALTDARGQLMGYLDGNRDRNPKTAAHAQAMFDCWAEQQEENWQYDHIAHCRDSLMAILKGKEYKAVMPMDDAAYLVFFDFDKSVVTTAAGDVLNTVVSDFRKGRLNSILVSGHTDTSGSNAYNQKLSERRAAAVKAALIDRGVPANRIVTSAYGETMPMIATGDSVREPSNRRGEIRFR